MIWSLIFRDCGVLLKDQVAEIFLDAIGYDWDRNPKFAVMEINQKIVDILSDLPLCGCSDPNCPGAQSRDEIKTLSSEHLGQRCILVGKEIPMHLRESAMSVVRKFNDIPLPLGQAWEVMTKMRTAHKEKNINVN